MKEFEPGDRLWAHIDGFWREVTFRRMSAGGQYAIVDTDSPWPWVSRWVDVRDGKLSRTDPEAGEWD